MAHFDIHTARKKASSYVREKVKSARLAFSDVSPIQLLAEEATNAEHWGPETSTMAKLSDAAFDLEEYSRIVEVLRSRLDPNAKSPWKQLVKTLTVLEYMLTHGPGSLLDDFRADPSNIEDLCLYNLIDQHGIDRGVSVRNKADRVLELLSKLDVLKEERARAQRISRGIHGFGSSINRMPAATENGGGYQRRSDVSDKHLDALEPMDAERKSLLSDDTVQEPHQNGGWPDWKPFEKCPTIPSYLGNEDVSSLSSDDSISVPVKPTRRQQGPGQGAYKKSLSSPGHFKPLNPQGSGKEDSSESHSLEPEKETGDSVLSQASSQGIDKEATPFDDAMEMELTETSLHEKVVQPRHLSVRRLFDFPKPVIQENAKQFDSHENVARSTEPGNTSNLPKIPPPPASRFRRIKQHFHASNLLDL